MAETSGPGVGAGLVVSMDLYVRAVRGRRSTQMLAQLCQTTERGRELRLEAACLYGEQVKTRQAEVAIQLSGTDDDEDTARAVMVRPVTDPDGPQGRSSWPGVVMVHEVFGIDDVLLRNAERLASAGYLVLVPDLFGEGNRLGCIVGAFRALRSERGQQFDVIDSAREALRADPECSGKVGVIGFCMGGGFALLSAGRGFEACSVNYGQLPKELDAVLVGACPIVASYGLADKSLAGSARRLGEALTDAEIPHDVKEYSGAGHSFMNEQMNGPRAMRPLVRAAGMGPNPEAAADTWGRIERFFERYLSS